MGFPMTWQRLIHRNDLFQRDYGQTQWTVKAERDRLLDFIGGDARRLEHDSTDASQLAYYADKTGLTQEQVRLVFEAFFELNCLSDCKWCAERDRHEAEVRERIERYGV